MILVIMIIIKIIISIPSCLPVSPYEPTLFESMISLLVGIWLSGQYPCQSSEGPKELARPKNFEASIAIAG